MRSVVATLAILAVAGCVSPWAEVPADDVATAPELTPVIPGPFEDARPGLYDLSEKGLVEVAELPGLTRTVDGGTTRYVQDVLEILIDNGDPLMLVQVLEEQSVTFAYDVDVAYRPESIVGDPRGSDFICIGTHIAHDRDDPGFYYERAAGRPGIPPPPDDYKGYRGGSGHARAGFTPYLEEVFGPRFQVADSYSVRLPAGTFVLLSNLLSQYPPAELQDDGNYWFQNYTLTGAHRILKIPPAPLFCAHGFAEFDGVQLAGEPPIQVARDGRLAVPARYGMTALVNVGSFDRAPPADSLPTNSMTVRYGDLACSAGGGRAIALHSFDAGTIEAEVQQWAGLPMMILAGMGQGRDLFASVGGVEQCSA